MSKLTVASRSRARPSAKKAPASFSPEESLLRTIFGVGLSARATETDFSNTGPAKNQSGNGAALETAVNFVEALRTAPMDRIRLIKLGIPARALERMANDMRIPLEQLATTLGLTRATVGRKVRENGALSADAGSRAIGMASLIGQVQKMIDESGDPDGFSAAEWVARWLYRPLPALGGQKPAELMDTSEGQALVSNILACMQAGTYA